MRMVKAIERPRPEVWPFRPVALGRRGGTLIPGWSTA